MMFWIITGVMGALFMAVGFCVYFRRSKEVRREIDNTIGIEHIIPWIAN